MTEQQTEQVAQQLVEARQKFLATLDVAKRELTPKTIAKRKVRQVRDRAEREVRARPAAAAGAATALFIILFRKPLAGLVRRLLRKTQHD
jgi:ElaB/YqjD/DUF883 family membrane-anchored ribosome-binding protein